jgi:hypothetical protein
MTMIEIIQFMVLFMRFENLVYSMITIRYNAFCVTRN